MRDMRQSMTLQLLCQMVQTVGTRILALARLKKAEGIKFPQFYIWCGTEDRWVAKNRILHKVFEEEGIEHIYAESTGDHSWSYWDEQIQVALRLFLEQK